MAGTDPAVSPRVATAPPSGRAVASRGAACAQVALTLIAQQLKDEDLEQLRNTFLVLDKNKETSPEELGKEWTKIIEEH